MGVLCQKLDLGVVDTELSKNHGFMRTTYRRKMALEKQHFLLHLWLITYLAFTIQ